MQCIWFDFAPIRELNNGVLDSITSIEEFIMNKLSVILFALLISSQTIHACEQVKDYISAHVNKKLVAYIFSENEFDELKRLAELGDQDVVNYYQDIFKGTFPVYFDITFYQSENPSFDFDFMAKNPRTMVAASYKSFSFKQDYFGNCFLGNIHDLNGQSAEDVYAKSYTLELNGQSKKGMIILDTFITEK